MLFKTSKQKASISPLNNTRAPNQHWLTIPLKLWKRKNQQRTSLGGECLGNHQFCSSTGMHLHDMYLGHCSYSVKKQRSEAFSDSCMNGQGWQSREKTKFLRVGTF